ncbi:hypothetical protein CDAR_570031 [Caerostris darwini]|uniref:Uncharacterized protein n=1 Tax=Caerostris darwini TaxID=1538125 RepID=A0AAV4RWZ3_9ARAC|nr:hypothetical protein CDAR_570031 [Caerostris darwini]
MVPTPDTPGYVKSYTRYGNVYNRFGYITPAMNHLNLSLTLRTRNTIQEEEKKRKRKALHLRLGDPAIFSLPGTIVRKIDQSIESRECLRFYSLREKIARLSSLPDKNIARDPFPPPSIVSPGHASLKLKVDLACAHKKNQFPVLNLKFSEMGFFFPSDLLVAKGFYPWNYCDIVPDFLSVGVLYLEGIFLKTA